MRSKIKAKLPTQKPVKRKSQPAINSSLLEEVRVLESSVISLIRGIPKERSYMHFLAERVRKAGKEANIEYLKILQRYVSHISANERFLHVDTLDELNSTLVALGVPNRSQQFTKEGMDAIITFERNLGEHWFSGPTFHRIQAEILMNPDSSIIFDHLVKERGLVTWDEIEPLFREASGHVSSLTEGTL